MAKAQLNSKLIAIVVIVLAAVVVIGCLVNKGQTNTDASTVSVTCAGETLGVFTLADLQALPAATVSKTIVSSGSGNESGQFTGVWLSDLIGSLGQQYLDGSYQFVTKAADGWAAQLSTEEVLTPENVLLVYAKDGELLSGREAGGNGPFRTVIVSDPFGNRSAKYLNEIEITK